MKDWESRFKRKPIQELRSSLATLRQVGARRLKRVRRWRRWFVRGAIVGAVWAVLYAPQSGAETRQAVGRLLRPLAEIGISLLTWLRKQQSASLDQAAARQGPGRSEHTTDKWPSTQSVTEASGTGATHQGVARSLPSSS
jgi:gas vesicle protein